MINKNFIGVLLVFPAFLVAFSCGTKEGPTEPSRSESITLNKSSLSLEPDAGQVNVVVNSTGDWSVSGGDKVSWITSVSPSRGSAGQATVIVEYLANETENSRTAQLTFTTGSKSVSLGISQAGKKKEPEPDVKNGFPARWETFSNTEQGVWMSKHTFASNLGTMKGLASMTAESGTRTLSFTVNSSSPAVGNLGEGDALVWTVPVKSLSAGAGVDFMLTIAASDNNVPKYWICEIQEGDQWKSVTEDLKSEGGVQYSFYVKNFSSYQYTTFVQSFTLGKAILNDNLKIRCRAVGDRNAAGSALTPSQNSCVFLPVLPWEPASIQCYEGITVKDTKKAAFLGNSFTYYYATHFMLKELSRSQGHQLRMRVHAKGSQYLENHLSLEKSVEVYKETGYDYAFLQEQSTAHSNYYLGTNDVASILSSTKSLAGKFAGAKVFLENTWAYPAVKDNVSWNGYGDKTPFFFCLQNGTRKLCSETGAVLSPIGVAFQKAYESGFTNLWYKDDKHQGRTGAYLKACVNYLMLYGERFDSNVSDCGLSSSDASRLRAIAESVVLDGYVIPHLTFGEPDVVSFKAEGGSGSVSVDADVQFAVSSDSGWLQVASTADRISWTVGENKDENGRTANISVRVSGFVMKTFTVVQAGKSGEAPDPGLGSGINDIEGNDYSGYVN